MLTLTYKAARLVAVAIAEAFTDNRGSRTTGDGTRPSNRPPIQDGDDAIQGERREPGGPSRPEPMRRAKLPASKLMTIGQFAAMAEKGTVDEGQGRRHDDEAHGLVEEHRFAKATNRKTPIGSAIGILRRPARSTRRTHQ